MDDLNKQKLDELFQEGSERYDFTYREDAWASMDEMLDQQDKKRKKRFLGWWIIVGVAALVGAFGLKHYFSYQQTLTETESSEQNFARTQTKSTTESIELNNDHQKTITPVLSEDTNSEKTETLITTDLPDRKLAEKDFIHKIHPKNQPAATTTIESFSTTATTTDFKTSVAEVSSVNSVKPKEFIGKEKKTTASTISQTAKIGTYPMLLSSGKLALLEAPAFSLASIQVPPILLENTAGKGEDEKSKLGNRFSVGLSAGPEFSFVGGTGQAKAGYYLGVELGYQLSNHFEVITGIGVSKKRYLGAGENYKTAPGFWTDEIMPMEFQGKCTVIEIPLAVNYYFKNANENGWFASVGATTYLMSNEWYDFIYDPAINRTDLKTSWTDKMANNHILGVGQVSFGYQHKIGKNTSLQLSPYAKIPLTGIGNGSVNVFSTGLRVTARFK